LSVSEPFIRRPVTTTLLMVGVLLAGLVAYRQLPVAPLPQVDYPTIVVTTALPGASADTMAATVTTPLERQLGQMPSLAQMTSVSSFSTSQITLQFTLDRSIDAAEQDVQAAINAATTFLPRTLPVPPTYSKSNPADAPILTLAITSDTLPLDRVSDFADSILAQRISQVPGVGIVTIAGGQKPALRIQVDPEALAGTGISLEDLRTFLVSANVHQPTGDINGPRLDYTLATNDQLTDATSLRPLVIAYRNGAPIRLREVAHVIDGVENAQLAGWANGARAIILNIQRQPGANIIDVVDRIRTLLPHLSAAMPNGVHVSVMSDRTETIRASVADVQFTLVLTVALVVMVIFAFLRNVRATIIPGVAVPLSLIGTFGIMYGLGFSLNNLSLMALTISTGFVVDDAIVMVENIERYIEAGDKPLEAALKGAKQIGFTIISLTVSLVAVLIPLLFMGGIIGRLFREFAVTLAAAIIVSAVLSLTLTPMMAGQLLKPLPPAEKRSRLFRASERVFEQSIALYDRGVAWVLDHQRTTLLVTIATVALTALLVWWIPKGFFPQQDTGLVLGFTETNPNASFEHMMDRQQAVADVIRHDPDVASVVSFIGADGTNATTNSGRLSITLRPRESRRASAATIIARLQSQLARVGGIAVYLQAAQDLSVETQQSRTQYQYTLEDADATELERWTPRMLEALRADRHLRHVATDLQGHGLALHVVVDRDTASRLGITAQTIDDTLYDAFGQRQIAIIFTQLNQYRMVLEVAPEFQRDPSALERLYVRSADGAAIPLGSFCRFERRATPLAVFHQGQFPVATLSFDLAPHASLGDAVNAIRDAERRIGLPATIRAQFRGAAEAFQSSLASEPLLVLAAIITVYIVLGVLYESFVHPITILSSLPSAGVGAILALVVTQSEFDVIALIGVVLLIGIVKKNAIMMIDFALEAERDEGLSPRDAIHRACLLRFRPIMMTTMAALLGAIPLAFGSGTGSELRRPLGITIVGGLLVSQLLTLFTTPVIYLYMDRARVYLLRRRPWRVTTVPPSDAPLPGGAS
jgi:multidrug efflux pump